MHEGVDIVHGWISVLTEIIGEKAKIKDSDLISTWINRGYLPDDRIRHFLKLDIPESLKSLCKNCSKKSKVKSRQGSTILTGRLAKYALSDKQPKKAKEKRGLHGFSKQIEIDGVRLSITKYEDPEWIYGAIEEILQSGDTEVILALEANIRVFLEKVRKERDLATRIERLEQELKKQNDYHGSWNYQNGDAENF